MAKKKQVQLETQLQPLPAVSCFPAKVNQVVMNLVTNAIDACRENGKVTVKSDRDGQKVRIEVIDDGSGIPDEIRQRIFDPFFTTKPVGQGTGLGLSISYGIIKDHGGQIEVESEPGKGTRFIVTLPVQSRMPVAARARQQMQTPSSPRPRRQGSNSEICFLGVLSLTTLYSVRNIPFVHALVAWEA